MIHKELDIIQWNCQDHFISFLRHFPNNYNYKCMQYRRWTLMQLLNKVRDFVPLMLLGLLEIQIDFFSKVSSIIP